MRETDYVEAVFEESWTFGDSAELSDQLLALVRSGQKTATCGALVDYETEGEPLPVVGRRDLITAWDGTPAVLIEVTEVSLTRFPDVTEDFALAEGEDETLEGWRIGHRAFFERCGIWAPDMMLVCQRFRVVKDMKA